MFFNTVISCLLMRLRFYNIYNILYPDANLTSLSLYNNAVMHNVPYLRIISKMARSRMNVIPKLVLKRRIQKFILVMTEMASNRKLPQLSQ